MSVIDILHTDNKYNIIYADPPWKYNDKGCNGNCEKHYKSMKLDDICNLLVNELAEKDCVLFLWTTYPMIESALKVIKSWGFKYKIIAFQWVKQNAKSGGFFFGVGQWTRGNTEACLLAVKGKPHKFKISNSVSQIIYSPVGKHSRKPPETRDKIVELLGDLQRIELFAREKANGWDCWGDEV
jgi:site-specific DNA-methyltransferase (adenine-specific)